MSRLEELKKKANRIDKDIAILDSDLKKLMDKLQEDFNIVNIDQARKRIIQIKKEREGIIKKIIHLYYKAEKTLKGIENNDRLSRKIR